MILSEGVRVNVECSQVARLNLLLCPGPMELLTIEY